MVNVWHKWLKMTKHDFSWHQQDIEDELSEYRQERKVFKKWSELSDIVYTYTRAKYSGHNLNFPLSFWLYPIGLIYMYPKYTLRFLFYLSAGKKIDPTIKIRAVGNPK